jgi:hypothetical protein
VAELALMGSTDRPGVVTRRAGRGKLQWECASAQDQQAACPNRDWRSGSEVERRPARACLARCSPSSHEGSLHPHY